MQQQYMRHSTTGLHTKRSHSRSILARISTPPLLPCSAHLAMRSHCLALEKHSMEGKSCLPFATNSSNALSKPMATAPLPLRAVFLGDPSSTNTCLATVRHPMRRCRRLDLATVSESSKRIENLSSG